MNTDLSPPSPGGEVIVYESEDGEARVDVRFDKETVWLTQRQMAAVFQSTPQNIVMHLRNVFSSKELDAESTSKDFLVVRTEGKRRVRRALKHYNLDAIISIGYRVNSKRAVRFRQWATRTLREHLVSGYTMNERRLAERGLDEARQTLELLARTLRNQALVDEISRLEESTVEDNRRLACSGRRFSLVARSRACESRSLGRFTPSRSTQSPSHSCGLGDTSPIRLASSDR